MAVPAMGRPIGVRAIFGRGAGSILPEKCGAAPEKWTPKLTWLNRTRQESLTTSIVENRWRTYIYIYIVLLSSIFVEHALNSHFIFVRCPKNCSIARKKYYFARLRGGCTESRLRATGAENYRLQNAAPMKPIIGIQAARSVGRFILNGFKESRALPVSIIFAASPSNWLRRSTNTDAATEPQVHVKHLLAVSSRTWRHLAAIENRPRMSICWAAAAGRLARRPPPPLVHACG